MVNTHKKYVDIAYGTRIMGGKEDAAIEMFIALAQSMPNDIQSIKGAYDNGDMLKLSRAVHQFRGSVCYTGLPTFNASLLQLELSAKKKDRSTVGRLFPRFLLESQQVLKEINEFLHSINSSHDE